jgi:2-aminoadipate transaminase
MVLKIEVNLESNIPFYRQVYEQIKDAIEDGTIPHGERLPATRELAGLIGLNRTTINAAYELLEAGGYIKGYVGRGSYVERAAALDWDSLMPAVEAPPSPPASVEATISFSASRPSEMQFPLEEFRETCQEVLDSKEAAQILQLGPAGGYGPLRRYLLEQARKSGSAAAHDEILITSGCQQAFDLIQRVLASRGETVVLEDPVYPGLRNAFLRGGARVLGVPVTLESGIDAEALSHTVEKERPRLMILTPNFQNPTGTTMPMESRKAVLEIARRFGVVVVENDLYGPLRYRGTEIAPIKQLAEGGDTIKLGSFSKIAFPGLRVGWVLGPKKFIARLTEAKEASDLHSDQLSQAVLLRFTESGRLAAHRQRMVEDGAERLTAILEGCERELPEGSRHTRPDGGMSVWVELPEGLDAFDLASRAARENVSYLPGRYFAVSRPQHRGLRLSFAGLDPAQIDHGMRVLGSIFKTEYGQLRRARNEEPSPALV